MSVICTTGAVRQSTLAGAYNPRWITQTYTADLNNDGNSDLVILGASYPVDGAPVSQPGLVAFGNDEGRFSLATESQFPISALTTTHPRELVFSDFNQDGYKDFFIASHGYDASPFPGEQNRLFLSNGDGTLRDATSNLPQVVDYTHGASAGDVNGDGFVDLIVGNVPSPNPTLPYILINKGNGEFSRNDSLLPTAAGQLLSADNTRMTSELLADLDGDGLADLVVGSAFSTATNPKPPRILWNVGGGFVHSEASSLPFGTQFGAENSIYDIQTSDINFDGLPDLMLAYQNSISLGGWELQILINQGGRSFVDATSQYIPDASSRTGGMPSANSAESQYWVQFINFSDINGDGRMDFTLDARGITVAPANLPVAYIHQADGSFQAVKVSDLVGTPNQMFDFSTQFGKWGGVTGFVKTYEVGGVATIVTLPVTFDPILPAQQDFREGVNLTGSTQADQLFGGTNNDQLSGKAGDDALDGGAGIDTALYAGNRASYTLTETSSGWIVSSAAEGTDTLSNVERLKFSDTSIGLDISGNAGQAYRVYQAAFDRTPDSAGLGYWISILDNGGSLADVGGGFVGSAEFSALYGENPTSTALVVKFYLNVLHRAPEQAGFDYWVNLVDTGVVSAPSLLTLFSESPENQSTLISIIGNGIEYTPFV